METGARHRSQADTKPQHTTSDAPKKSKAQSGSFDKVLKYVSLSAVLVIAIMCFQSSSTVFPKILLAPAIGVASRFLRFLTWDGAAAGVLVGSVIILSGWPQAGALLSFFVSASVATKVTRRLKPKSSVNSALDDDSKKGRGAPQVFAVSALPALLCLLSAPFFRPYLPGFIGSLCSGREDTLLMMYYAYLACCSADTLSSELGGLSPRRPLLLLSLQPVPTGVDGAVSFEGLVASLVGGGLVGLFSPWSWAIFALWGVVGSLLDSFLGCLLQPSSLREKEPQKWKVMNVTVNFLSASLTSLGIAFVDFTTSAATPLVVFCVMILCLHVSSLPYFWARKLLHVATSLLVIFIARAGNEWMILGGAVVIFVTHWVPACTFMWTRFNPEKKPMPGILLYAVATGWAFYSLTRTQAIWVLGAMYFADPLAGVVGHLLGADKPTSPSPSLSGKTLAGGCAFGVAALLWVYFVDSGSSVLNFAQAFCVASTLTLVELASGPLDNITIPLVLTCYLLLFATTSSASSFSSAFSLSHHFSLGLVMMVTAVVFFGSPPEVKKSVDAFWRFARPHTIVGTTLSIVTVTVLCISGTTSLLSPAVFGPLIVALIASLHANVYIVGLNQLYDIEIDRVNKPYLPVASGEFSVTFATALVTMHGLSAVATALAFGTPALVATVVGSCILGTVYSVPLPFFPARWKRFPFLAALCIFVVRGFIVQVGFYEHTRTAIQEANIASLPVWFQQPVILFSVVFFTVFGVAIALFKDIPDIVGDKEANIRTLAVRLGGGQVVNICVIVLSVSYLGATLFWVSRGNLLCAACHALVGAALAHKLLGTNLNGSSKEVADSIRSSYMAIWKAFYLEYVLLLISIW